MLFRSGPRKSPFIAQGLVLYEAPGDLAQGVLSSIYDCW